MGIAIQARALIAATLLGATLAPFPVRAASEAVVLEPTMAWNVDWAANYCTLQRTFGTEEAPLLLRINSYQPGYAFEFFIAGEQTRPLGKRGSLAMTFGDHGPFDIEHPKLADSANFGPGFIFSENIHEADRTSGDEILPDQDKPMPVADPAFDAGLRSITLSSNGHSLELRTGPLAAALKAMRSCVDNMVASWGLDPAVQAGGNRMARPRDTARLAKRIQAFYPPAQARKGENGWLSLLAMIDATGKPTSCKIQLTYADSAFNDQPCKVVMDSHFEPALDARGQPVASFWRTTINYLLT